MVIHCSSEGNHRLRSILPGVYLASVVSSLTKDMPCLHQPLNSATVLCEFHCSLVNALLAIKHNHLGVFWLTVYRMTTSLQLMSNICVGTSYKSVKKRVEDRCLWRVLEMEINDLLFIAVHQKKKKKYRIGSDKSRVMSKNWCDCENHISCEMVRHTCYCCRSPPHVFIRHYATTLLQCLRFGDVYKVSCIVDTVCG